jgi:WD40 repeat protein
MLAAGGYAPTVQLWDARACTKASTSLPLMREDYVTSLHCSPSCHCIIAGTSSGMLVSWDTRKIAPSNVHVFGSRGPTQAQPTRVDHLPTLAAYWPTVLSYRAQLHLCAGVLASAGELQSMIPQLSAVTGAAAAAANTVRSTSSGARHGASGSGAAASLFRMGLSRSSTVATNAHASKVNHLVEDPSDPRRVAFSLACGAAGANATCHVPLPLLLLEYISLC